MNQPDLFEGDALPVDVDDDPLESDIQSACVELARRHGAYARKFSSPANRSVPDYILTLHGATWYVEFKRKGKEPTKAQADEHQKIRDAGGVVWVIDNANEFRLRLARLLAVGRL